MTDPTQPRSRGRHSQPDAGSGAGLPAAELLAAWASAGSDTLQATDEAADTTLRPRRRRRYAPETDGTGVQVLPPRAALDVADVEITGLAAAGIADIGLAAAGLDLSAFGIDRSQTGPSAHRAPAPAAWPWAGETPAAAPTDAAPRTTEMPVAPPAVPHLGEDERAGRGAQDRRSVPAPRPAGPTTADRVVADRFADADTDPGWLSATGRPAPTAATTAGRTAVVAPLAAEPQAPALGSLASLFVDAPATGPQLSRPAAPGDEPATEVHPAPSTDELLRQHDDDAESWQSPSLRHRTAGPEDGDDAGPGYPDDAPLEHGDHHDDELAAPVTGGLEVIVDGSADEHDDRDDLDDVVLGGSSGGGGRGGRGGGGGGSGRRKRRGPITVVLSLLVLIALVAGLAIGGLALWRTINPTAADYTGSGTGSVDVKVDQGDSLRTIAGTLAGADVIASTGPFEDAAKANPAATGIQPGIYTMRLQMSGKAALDLLLDPATRQVSKVTIPEGLTEVQVLQRLADQTGVPLEQWQAAAADPVAIGLPSYANGLVEGFLFPATYDITPDQTPVDVLRQMVDGTDRVLNDLQVPVEQRLSVLTEASIVQAEAGSVEDMGKVAQVLDNRLADGMPLQLDTTVNYANNKSGITTTSEDRQNPSPYNTYVHTGLPPGAISNPGEEAVRAVLNPTPGDWLFFVVVNPDTGETRFAVTAAEHNQNVLLFQQWLQDNPGN
ncbi:MAG: hypothetical protein JWR28_2754 [Modestobacter sp.]|nr:hypothetical protein [Modestobacter sp.]